MDTYNNSKINMNPKMLPLNSILIVLILFILLSISFIILLNGDNSATTQILLKVFGAIFIALFLILYGIFSFYPTDSKETKILILRNKQGELESFVSKLLLVNSKHIKGYQTINTVYIFSNKDKRKLIPLEKSSLDLIEMSLWGWLSKKYSIHWDTTNNYFQGISGGSGTIDKAEDSDKYSFNFSRDMIKKELEENIFIDNNQYIGGIKFPPGTQVTTERTRFSRTLILKNDFINELRIEIEYISNSGLDYTLLGEAIKKTLKNPDSWFSNNFKISFKVEYNRWRKDAPKMKKIRKWVNEIMIDFYNDFHWELIEPDLEKAFSIL